MRPPDENQPGSTRPPFMSATRRPASTEDNILARMERDARRGGGGAAWKRSWIAWCGLASLAIIGLIGFLASLARENIEIHQAAPLAATTAAPDPAGARPPIAAVPDAGFAPLPPASVPAQPKLPAAVADARPARPSARPDAATRPALVMLKPAPVKAVAVAGAAKAATATPRKSAPVAAVKPPPRAAVASVPRSKKPSPVPATAAAEPAVDSDVALLSAIIMHASRHAGERAQLEAARCGAGKKCAPAPAQDPLTSLKATD